jgi:hypothetical protein
MPGRLQNKVCPLSQQFCLRILNQFHQAALITGAGS